VIEKYISPVIYSKVSVKNTVDRNDEEIKQTVATLFDAMRNKAPCFELEVYGALYQLLTQLYSKKYLTPSDKSAHSSQTQIVITLINWIENNLSEPINLTKLSEISGLSPKYLCRIFKEYTSKTLIQYINELRIENACYELAVNNKNITEASYQSGFDDLSYFCKLFKRLKGITPKEYKRQYRWSNG